MKRKTSKEILAESFRELAGQMPIDKITIQDIVKNCGYSSATFYRQFKDKYDLIVWDYSRDVEKILDHYNCFKKCILKSAGVDRLAEKTEMYIRLYCQGTVALTGEWMLGKYGVETEELV